MAETMKRGEFRSYFDVLTEDVLKMKGDSIVQIYPIPVCKTNLGYPAFLCEIEGRPEQSGEETSRKPVWAKTVDQRIDDGEIDPEYFFEGGTK